MVEEEAISVALDGRRRQEVDQALAHSDRAGSGSAAAMRRGERLVQVEVDDVEAHVAGAGDADQRIEVRAVVVDERAGLVRETRDVDDVLLEDAERVRVGEHHRGDGAVEVLREILDVDGAVVIALHRHDVEPARRGRRRVGTVRGVGDEHARAIRVAAVRMVRLDHAQPGPLAVRSCRGLQRHARHAR